MSDSSLPFPDDAPEDPPSEARRIQPFQFLQGRPDQEGPSFQQFTENRETTATSPIHPTMTGDVPEDIDD